MLVSRRLLRNKFAVGTIAVVISVLAYGEWLSYELAAHSWLLLSSAGGSPAVANQIVRILLVADPQLIGYRHEAFGGPARWDSDRYLSTSFALALRHFRPDVILFMGDLFDEGSIASDGQFVDTLARFRDIYDEPPAALYLPGDNDVGGEGRERVKPVRQRRFDVTFGSPTYKASADAALRLFARIGVDVHEGFVFDGTSWRHQIDHSPSTESRFRLLLSHARIIRSKYRDGRKIFEAVKPNLIFSGDDHDARHLSFDTVKQEAKKVDLDEHSFTGKSLLFEGLSARNTTCVEIQTPTCSYRMGMHEMGFGAATLESLPNEEYRLEYTILWLPHRYSILYLYAWTCCAVTVLVFIKISFLVRLIKQSAERRVKRF